MFIWTVGDVANVIVFVIMMAIAIYAMVKHGTK